LPNRFQSNQYKVVYPLIAERDGEYCLACFIETGQRRGPKSVKLEIDHADGDRRNWAPSNLHLLCKAHNIKYRSLNVKRHSSLMATYSAENERGRVWERKYQPATKRTGAYQLGSPEMQVNSIAEVNWLEFMHNMIETNGSISKDDAINAGAIAADDVNPQTTERYWKKHTSILGRFKEIKLDGIRYAVLRQEQQNTPSGARSRNGNGHKAGALDDTVPVAGRRR